MADKMINIRKRMSKAEGDYRTVATTPGNFHKTYEPDGWEALDYEDGTPYETPDAKEKRLAKEAAAEEKRIAREAAKAAKASPKASGNTGNTPTSANAIRTDDNQPTDPESGTDSSTDPEGLNDGLRPTTDSSGDQNNHG